MRNDWQRKLAMYLVGLAIGCVLVGVLVQQRRAEAARRQAQSARQAADSQRIAAEQAAQAARPPTPEPAGHGAPDGSLPTTQTHP